MLTLHHTIPHHTAWHSTTQHSTHHMRLCSIELAWLFLSHDNLFLEIDWQTNNVVNDLVTKYVSMLKRWVDKIESPPSLLSLLPLRSCPSLSPFLPLRSLPLSSPPLLSPTSLTYTFIPCHLVFPSPFLLHLHLYTTSFLLPHYLFSTSTLPLHYLFNCNFWSNPSLRLTSFTPYLPIV